MVDADHTHPPSHGTLEQTRGVERGRWEDEKDKRDGCMDGMYGWMERGKSVGGKTEGDPRVSPNSCHVNKTHSQAETKRNRGIDGKIQESESEPVIHMSEQTWVRSGNETARCRENRACTLLDKYTLTPLHIPTHTHKNTHSHHNIKP